MPIDQWLIDLKSESEVWKASYGTAWENLDCCQ